MANSIDNVLNEYLHAAEEYFERKSELQDVMKQGYLDISKARYIMGVTAVSEYQYSSDMVATATAVVAVRDVDVPSFSVDRHSIASIKGNCQDLAASASKSESTSSGVRRRKGEQDISEDSPTSASLSTAYESSIAACDASDARLPTSKQGVDTSDPLRWFGVLVPPSLRSAQRCFIDALNRSAEVATLEAKCNRLRKQYLALKAGATGEKAER